MTHASHAFFMLGTCVMVQLGHGRAMKRGGYGMLRFFAETWRETKEACHLMDARNHASASASE